MDAKRAPQSLAETRRYLPRQALVQNVLEMVGDGVVLIGAPCGYGKSWLVRQVYEQLTSGEMCSGRALFLRINAQTTRSQFARELMAGVQRTGFARLKSEQFSDEDMISVLCECRSLPIIVIDMDGRPPSRALRALVANLVSALANRTSLVVACRRPEHLALSRLEMVATVRLIGAKTLGFTPQETAAARNLDRQSAATWCSIALGWPVACGAPWLGEGLQDGDRVVEADVFAAIESYIERDMLVEMSESDAELLQKCAVLEKIEPGVYHALSLGAPWSRLVNLIDSGVPTVSTEHYCDEIVLHPLLRRYLEKRLHAWTPRWYEELHRAAADYYLAMGDTSRALAQIGNIDDNEIIAEIADKAGGWRASLIDGFLPLRVANRCDEAQIHSHPGAALARIYWKAQSGRVQEAAYELRQFRQRHPGSAFCSDVATIEAVIRIYDDQPVDESLMETLREQEGGEFSSEPLLEPGCETLQAALLNNAGEREKAYAVATSSISQAERLGSPYVEFYGRWQQALALHGLGRVRQANDAYGRLAPLADQMFGDSSNEARLIRLISAHSLVMEGRTDEAQVLADDLGGLFRLHSWFDGYCHAMKAAIALAEYRGEAIHRQAVVAEFRSIATARGITRLAVMIDLQESRACVRARDLDKAQAYLSDARCRCTEIEATWGLTHVTVFPALKVEEARIHLCQGAFELGAACLDPVLGWELPNLDTECRLESLLLAAYAAMGRRRLREVGEYLTIATEIAAEYHLFAPMRDPINWAAQLASFAGNHAVPIDAIVYRKLCHMIERDAEQPIHASVQHHGTRDATHLLTARETDVVVLLAEGLSSKEIARRLDIGEGTVRTHRKHLYHKLGAKRRSQAILKARELRLV